MLEDINDKKVSDLFIGSTVVAILPLIILVKLLVSEGLIEREKVISVLQSGLIVDGLPEEARELVVPVWRNLITSMGEQ